MNDGIQYTPLTPVEIMTYFQEVKQKIELLQSTVSAIVKLNNLKVEEEPKRRTAKRSATMAKPKHDDVKEDKELINKAIAKHDAKEHPGHAPTTIKKGGRPQSVKKGGRGR